MRFKRTIFIASAGVVTAALIAAAHAETLKPNNSYWIPAARHSTAAVAIPAIRRRRDHLPLRRL